MNVITCIAWVKKGVAASIPEKVTLNPNELEKIIRETQLAIESKDDDSEEDAGPSETQPNTKTMGECSTANDEYNFDDYDNESGDIRCHISNLASFSPCGKDPFITNDDEDSDREDDIIKKDDNLILVGRIDNDACILEVFIYNEREGSFYCHHDIWLSAYPLCIEWLSYDPVDSKPGNLCAIGNMTSIIEIWDLDVIDCLKPAYKLGCRPNKKRKQKRVGHKNAVLDLAWNQNYTHVLASGSVDQTVLLWDLDNCKPVTKLDSFNDKVQALKWHPQNTHQLLTGCADKSLRLFDCKEEAIARNWLMSGEVESVMWNNYNANYCIAGTDNGYIEYFDVRANEPVWKIKAHEKEVIGLCFSSSYKSLLISASNDGTMKIWDLMDHKNLTLLCEKKSNVGTIQCLAASPDNGFAFVVGGDKKQCNLEVLDLLEISAVRERFMYESNHITSHSSATEFKNGMMNVTEEIKNMEVENME